MQPFLIGHIACFAYLSIICLSLAQKHIVLAQGQHLQFLIAVFNVLMCLNVR